MNRSFHLALASIVGLSVVSLARSETQFVNFSNQPVYVAKRTYQPYSSTTPGGLPSESPEGWYCEGWWVVQPGGVLTMQSGAYYVENAQGALTWQRLSSSPGVVRRASFNINNAFFEKRNQHRDFARLTQQGFRVVQFQDFEDGRYDIQGNAYRLASRTFTFDFRSRDVEVHGKAFHVPGTVVSYEPRTQSRHAFLTQWTQRDNYVNLVTTTRGYQAIPGVGAREESYYKGSVTVHYLARN